MAMKGEGIEAARTLQRRMRARVRLRQRRDRKLREEWLGRRFIYGLRDELTGQVANVGIQLVGFDPGAATVRMLVDGSPVSNVWTTDSFWAALRYKVLREA